jgi:hypothetical protein
MTTKLEQEFFEAMGVPKEKRLCTRGYQHICSRYIKNNNCIGCNDFITEYPTITDTIVSRLICVLALQEGSEHIIQATTMEALKDDVIKDCIWYQDEIREEVQKLFN